MTSQSDRCFTVNRNYASYSQRVLFIVRGGMISGVMALLCSNWLPSTQAAEMLLQTVSTTTARALSSPERLASRLGTPVTTNYDAFRDYCKNPINPTELKTLCLSLTEGGPLDSSLTPEDEPLTAPPEEADREFMFQMVSSSAIALYHYDPILYQYNKVTLFPLR